MILDIKVCAGIVLYNPEIERLKKNIAGIIDQVDILYVFDNCSSNIIEIEQMLQPYKKIVLIRSKKNEGIAVAVNRMVDAALKDGCKWFLALDQDSVCPSNMILEFSKYTGVEKVAIICPRPFDVRKAAIDDTKEPRTKYEYVQYAITSGSFLNLDIFKRIGSFDEFLFVGLIDTDYCMRVNINEYCIIRCNNVIMDQEFGEITPSRFEKIFVRIGKTLHIKLILKLAYKRKVSPMRVYYATRNQLYFIKKYKNYINENKEKSKLIIGSVFTILRAEEKKNVFKAMIRGWKEGQSVNIEPYTRVE